MHSRQTTIVRPLAACATLALASISLGAPPIEAAYDTPFIDRWVYPFNTSPGFRAVTATFSALGQENAFPPLSFDQRDGQFLVGVDTADQIPPGRGVCGYRVTAARVTVAVATHLAFRMDPTQDDWTTYLAGATDADGRPLELFGAAYRGGFTAATYIEGTSSGPPAGTPFGPSTSSDVRFVYPTDFIGGDQRDVSNNIRDAFNPKPFSIGVVAGLPTGQFVPVDSDVVFDLNVTDADVQAYLRAAMDEGRLRLLITSLQPAFSDGGPGAGEFASFYAKEFTFADGLWTRFALTVELTPSGDANGSGVVDFADITAVLSNWGAAGAPGMPGDADCSGAVNFADITAVLSNWGATG